MVYADKAHGQDDLSWGATRQVAGQPVKARTEDKTAIFDGTSIPLRKWSDWERSRLRKLRRAARKHKEAEKMEKRARQQFRGPPGSAGFLGTPVMEDRSDAQSSISDEDMWGSDIGGVSNPSHHHGAIHAETRPDDSMMRWLRAGRYLRGCSYHRTPHQSEEKQWLPTRWRRCWNKASMIDHKNLDSTTIDLDLRTTINTTGLLYLMHTLLHPCNTKDTQANLSPRQSSPDKRKATPRNAQLEVAIIL